MKNSFESKINLIQSFDTLDKLVVSYSDEENAQQAIFMLDEVVFFRYCYIHMNFSW